MYWQIAGVPGVVAVSVGSFADPKFPVTPPSFSVYEARRHAWTNAMPSGVEIQHFD